MKENLAARWLESRDLQVEKISVSDPQPDQVQVRVGSAGICGSDLHYVRGDKPVTLGAVPGHEIGGVVSAVGSNVKHLYEGDMVGIEPVTRCGTCRFCKTGAYQVCRKRGVVGESYDGGMSEYVNVPGYTAFKAPRGFDSELAALAEPLTCSVYGLERVDLRFYETALIVGAGTVGLGALINVKALGANAIIIARHHQQQELARQLGADEVLGDDEAGRERLAELVKQDAFDLAIETVGGHGDTLNQALCSVRPLGRVLVLGVFFSPTVAFKSFQIMDRAIIGAVLYGNMSGKANYQMALEILSDHGEAARALVTHRFALNEVNQAFAAALDKKSQSIKVHIRPAA